MSNTGEKTIQLVEYEGTTSISAAGNVVTEEIDFSRSYRWSLMTKKVGTDGTPQIEIEGSNDGVDWSNVYTDCSQDPPVPLVIDLERNPHPVFDEIFPFSRYRVRVLANDNTIGTVECTLNLQFQ